jgi:hypothetical protein
MDAPLRKSMTLEAFLEWEDRQPLRHEFDGVRAISMTGGTQPRGDPGQSGGIHDQPPTR